MRQIRLHKGHIAIVDDEDFKFLSQYKWYSKIASCVYAIAGIYNPNTKQTKQITMHRLLMKPIGHQQVDHINGNSLDNRRSNLRLCSRQENNWHTRKYKGRSRYKGVWWQAKDHVWRSAICANRKRIHLGPFKTEVEAARAYDKAAKYLHGKFAVLNLEEPPR